MMKNNKDKVFYPRLEFCTDNGAMDPYAESQQLKSGEIDNLSTKERPRWSLGELAAIKVEINI